MKRRSICKFCNISYAGLSKSTSRSHPMCRFKSRITIDENNCWNWYKIKANGDLLFFDKGKQILARKWLLLQNNIEIVKKQIIIPICKNDMCVNLDHLKQMTQKKAHDSKYLAARQGKITKQIKESIIQLYFIEKLSLKDILKKVKLSTATVYKIIKEYRAENYITENRLNKISPSQQQDILQKYEKDRWIILDIARHYKVDWSAIKYIINKHIKSIINHDICIQCSKQHDNLGSQYCSTQCMNEWILNEK